jgi:hypothetical protein
VWKQACGDPQNGVQDTGDGLWPQDCATGADAPPREDLLEILSRAYPRSAPGAITSLAADGASIDLTGSAPGGGCGLEVWVPGTTAPQPDTSGISDVEVAEVPGGWLVTGCVDGDYSLATP